MPLTARRDDHAPEDAEEQQVARGHEAHGPPRDLAVLAPGGEAHEKRGGADDETGVPEPERHVGDADLAVGQGDHRGLGDDVEAEAEERERGPPEEHGQRVHGPEEPVEEHLRLPEEGRIHEPEGHDEPEDAAREQPEDGAQEVAVDQPREPRVRAGRRDEDGDADLGLHAGLRGPGPGRGRGRMPGPDQAFGPTLLPARAGRGPRGAEEGSSAARLGQRPGIAVGRARPASRRPA